MLTFVFILAGLIFLTSLFISIHANFMAVEMYRTFLKKTGEQAKVSIWTYQMITYNNLPEVEDMELTIIREQFYRYKRRYVMTIFVVMLLVIGLGFFLEWLG